ncbi:MAG TPA: Hsp20/alpha crystallin family protein [Acidobacteriota bacterium]|jgi:HSP20 family protein
MRDFRDLIGLQERMNRLFDDSISRSRGQEDLSNGSWSPAVDIYETEDQIVIKAELPEVNKDSIDLRIENNTLSIRGERKLSDEAKRENYHRIERAYGPFYRIFSLPNVVDPENVIASYKDGVLKLALNKRAESRPRSIKIDTAD